MYHREPGGRKTECAPRACNFSIIAIFGGDTQREPLRRGEILLERLSITFTSNGKRELVVSSLLVVYCSLFLHLNKQFHAIFYP